MADNIKQIHANKLAKKDKIYNDSQGNYYIGLANGRLEKVDKTTSIETNSNLDSNNSKITESYFSYDSSGNITKIYYYTKKGLDLTKNFSYDGDGNIANIIHEGSQNFIKSFLYDSNGNITKITIN
jgi:hypothetical protein